VSVSTAAILTPAGTKTEIDDEFTRTLRTILPPDLAKDARIHVCGPSGADPVETALELARAATGKTDVIAFTGAHQGLTTTRLPFPQDYRCPYGVGGIGGVRIAIEQLRRLLVDHGTAPPAALIVEPVQGDGVLPAPDEWLRAVRAETAKHGILLIADETRTGLGRTGELWGVDHAGITPDIMVLPKVIGSDLPLAVIACRADLDVPAEYGEVDTGTPRSQRLAMAAGIATIRHILERDLVTRARKIGERMRAAFADAARELPAIGDVRGLGLMLGIELVDPDGAVDTLGARAAVPGLARKVRTAALERGLLVELGGRRGAVLRLLPPLTITDAEADELVAILLDAIVTAQAQMPRLCSKAQGAKSQNQQAPATRIDRR
jgi:diaminobutyrate-2-oxoglutarate transaminase